MKNSIIRRLPTLTSARTLIPVEIGVSKEKLGVMGVIRVKVSIRVKSAVDLSEISEISN